MDGTASNALKISLALAIYLSRLGHPPRNQHSTVLRSFIDETSVEETKLHGVSRSSGRVCNRRQKSTRHKEAPDKATVAKHLNALQRSPFYDAKKYESMFSRVSQPNNSQSSSLPTEKLIGAPCLQKANATECSTRNFSSTCMKCSTMNEYKTWPTKLLVNIKNCSAQNETS